MNLRRHLGRLQANLFQSTAVSSVLKRNVAVVQLDQQLSKPPWAPNASATASLRAMMIAFAYSAPDRQNWARVAWGKYGHDGPSPRHQCKLARLGQLHRLLIIQHRNMRRQTGRVSLSDIPALSGLPRRCSSGVAGRVEPALGYNPRCIRA